ncbi:Polyphosphoinositide phosphatase [Fasciola gigantica]|uniref:Polyphosphoinositide phosphatase n=1 Tax=Fasciola gigantica TaxID=46835 RepID=A0A504YMP8_FASGI|nr:Polyphosphoinositide phosphatase [Fasciola gigantica]
MESVIDCLPQSPRELQQAAASALLSGTVEPSLVLSTKCDGLVGVVRFLRGYYLILITKSRLIAQIGEHKIFKVEDTTTIYIPGSDGTEVVINAAAARTRGTPMSKSGPDDANAMLVPPGRLDPNPEWIQFCATAANRARIFAEEARYLKLFTSVDLGSNFYYSHTYDLSHTLQYNMQLMSDTERLNSNFKSTGVPKPNDRFVWNWRLIPPRFRPDTHRSLGESESKYSSKPLQTQWFIPLCHGTISQAAISACGLPLFITLIGRRSRHFAGTRFLKRGTSLLGNVANEVETEQIVHDTSYFSLRRTRCSSYVQLRGSVPLFWSQESSKVVVGRPPLELSREDPYYEAFGAHFRNLFERYGAPIIVLNLMKRRERRRFELALSEGYERGLAYLTQNLYDEHGDTLALQYGGSQLVHNIDTYRKTHKLSSQSRDFLQTLSRYYSNKFSDWDKQCATDLFLRIYRPVCWSGTVFQLVCEFLQSSVRRPSTSSSASSLSRSRDNQSTSHGDSCGCNPDAVIAQTAAALAGPLWDLTSDNYVHWLDAWSRLPTHRKPLTDWCPRPMLQCLPRATQGQRQGTTSASSMCQNHMLYFSDPCVDRCSERYQTQSYQILDKPASMPHLRWIELLVHSPSVDSSSPMMRSSSMTDTSVRPKSLSLLAPTTPSLGNSSVVDTPANDVPGSPRFLAVDSPVHLSRRSSLSSSHSVPILDPARTTPGRKQPRAIKLRKVLNLSSLSPTLETSNTIETASLGKGTKLNSRKSGSVSRTNEKPDDQNDDSSSDSDSIESTESFLKFYPPTLVIHSAQAANSVRSALDSSFTTGRTGDNEAIKSRSPIPAGKRLNEKSSSGDAPVSIADDPNAWVTHWSSPPSVFDPSAVLVPVNPEVRSAYEGYMNVSNFTCSGEMYLVSNIVQAPNSEDMAKYQDYVHAAEGYKFPVPSESLTTYTSTARVAHELRC